MASVKDDAPTMKDASAKLNIILPGYTNDFPSLTEQMKSKPSTSRSDGSNKRRRDGGEQEQLSAGDELAAAGYQYVRSLGFFKAKDTVRVDA